MSVLVVSALGALALPGVPEGMDPNEVVVEGRGWDGVTLGLTKREALRAMGRPDKATSRWLVFRDQYGIDLLFDKGGKKAIELRFQAPFAWPTTRGIRPGSSLLDVEKAYGVRTKEIETVQAGFESQVLYRIGDSAKMAYPGEGILFWFKDEKVAQIVIGRRMAAGPARSKITWELISVRDSTSRGVVIRILDVAARCPITRQNVLAVADEAVRHYLQHASVHAVAVRFWPPGQPVKGVSSAVVEWAPEGNWALAGTYPRGHYERHDYFISHLPADGWK